MIKKRKIGKTDIEISEIGFGCAPLGGWPVAVSDNAAERIKQIMSKAENSAIGVRVGVKSGGCAGMSYVMEYANEIKPNEEIIEEKGVKVFIDPKAIMYLLGTEMDYKKEKFSSQFIFKNPNETERCGCGESFKV